MSHMDNIDLTIDDCEIREFMKDDGFVRINGESGKFALSNSYVHNVKRGIRIDYSHKDENNVVQHAAVGDIIVESTTFVNCTGTAAIHWNATAMPSVDSVAVNQCSFHTIGDNVFKLGEVKKPVTVTNCIFDAVAKDMEVFAVQ